MWHGAYNIWQTVEWKLEERNQSIQLETSHTQSVQYHPKLDCDKLKKYNINLKTAIKITQQSYS